MPSPHKHPKTGVYYFRQRIPADLHHKLGNKTVLRSLRTKDPKIAKERHAEQLRNHAAIWEAHRQGPKPLALKQIVSLAGAFYREYTQMLENEPGEPQVWAEALDLIERIDSRPDAIETWYGSFVDGLLQRHSIVTDEYSRQRLLDETHRTFRDAVEQLNMRSQGNFSPDTNLARFPPLDAINEQALEPAASEETSIWSLFDLWAADHSADGRSAKTRSDYRQKVQSLADFIGHSDASRITTRDIIGWCEHLRHEKQLTGKTVKAKYLAAVRVIFAVGKERQRLTNNPAEQVRVRVPKRTIERSPGYTDAEAKKILKAAMNDPEDLGKRSAENKRAIRWGPW